MQESANPSQAKNVSIKTKLPFCPIHFGMLKKAETTK